MRPYFKEVELHSLNVDRVVCVYLSATAFFQRSDSLFVLTDGTQKGLAAASPTISRWIRQMIV